MSRLDIYETTTRSVAASDLKSVRIRTSNYHEQVVDMTAMPVVVVQFQCEGWSGMWETYKTVRIHPTTMTILSEEDAKGYARSQPAIVVGGVLYSTSVDYQKVVEKAAADKAAAEAQAKAAADKAAADAAWCEKCRQEAAIRQAAYQEREMRRKRREEEEEASWRAAQEERASSPRRVRMF